MAADKLKGYYTDLTLLSTTQYVKTLESSMALKEAF